MFRCRSFAPSATLLVALAVVLLVAGVAIDARASFPKLPKLKEKAAEVKDAAKSVLPDKTAGDKPVEKGQGDAATTAGDEAGPAAKPAAGGASEDMALYTKYDFVPGDRVFFFDDLSGDEMGEFPHRWKLDSGVFEVAKLAGESWILNTGAKGYIRPDIPDGLPERYTIEMEIWDGGPATKGHWYAISWMGADNRVLGEFWLKDHFSTTLYFDNDEKAQKNITHPAKGKHIMRVMATQTTLKCYVDNERVANVPKIKDWKPIGVRVTCDRWQDEPTPMVMRNFCIAEGGKPMKDQFAETGRFVTHGILFDTGSAVIKAESFKTLSMMAEMLTGDPALKVSIEGHTDSDGTPDGNLALSQKRADAVKAWLVAQGLAADRLQAKGMGQTKPIDTNGTLEGKANNRRVELVKL